MAPMASAVHWQRVRKGLVPQMLQLMLVLAAALAAAYVVYVFLSYEQEHGHGNKPPEHGPDESHDVTAHDGASST